MDCVRLLHLEANQLPRESLVLRWQGPDYYAIAPFAFRLVKRRIGDSEAGLEQSEQQLLKPNLCNDEGLG